MKALKVLIIFVLASLFNCSNHMQDLRVNKCASANEDVNSNHSRAAIIDEHLQTLVSNGIPGVALAIYDDEGWYTSAAGFAKIEEKTLMQICHLQYLQSIAKTFMAVAILKLYEEGKINLDASIIEYLPHRVTRHITSAENITVKMLMNHTSGIPEYNSEPSYVSYLLQHPDHIFNPEDYLQYISKKKLDFSPGSKYSYRNTNYLLLALIGDALTGDHSTFIRKNIFEPLQLQQTFYRGDTNYLNYPELVNTYWDRHSDGIVENASQLQRNNVASLIGDDGIVATPMEAVKFLKGLNEGKLLKPSTLELMKTWVNDAKGRPTYGLGLDYSTEEFLQNEAYGHSGGGIGAGCYLYYFPKKNLYLFIGINLGTVTDSPIHQQAEPHLNKLYEAILN